MTATVTVTVTASEQAEAMQHPIHTSLARCSLPQGMRLACVRQTDPLSVLDVSPQSGEPGWSSEGTGRGGGMTSVEYLTYEARGSVNWGT